MPTSGFDLLTPRSTPAELYSCRILQNKPIARNQWMLWLKRENGDFPNFELGNFCMISMPEFIDPLIPRPFAICEAKEGMYSFIYRVSGKQTKFLTTLTAGMRLDCLGPLGRGFKRSHFSSGSHVFVAGGVGYASLLPLAQSVASAAQSQFFYGVREELEVIRKGPLNCEYASDDGSIGHHGRLHELLKQKNFAADSWFYVCGPTPMMKACASVLPAARTYYFLEESMGCGFGICVGCVIPQKDGSGQLKFVKTCTEGPMFLGASLDDWMNTASGGHG